MFSLKVSRWTPAEPASPTVQAARRVAARSLRSASAALARWARRLAVPAARVAPADPRLEFYAEAGAPEGALYLDGHLVGWVQGVRRL